MGRCYLWLSALVVAADATPAAGYGEDLYGDEPSGYEPPKYEAPKYEPPKYEPPNYEAPKYEEPKYEEPKYDEPKYEETKVDEYDKKEDEYAGVPYEEQEVEYFPQQVSQKLYLEPCQHDFECGQGICDTDHKCRCMDFWWTPDPKPATARRLGALRVLQQYDAAEVASAEIKTRPCSLKRKSQAEAFLLQLFLGPLGLGAFYLGWSGFGAACLILGMFPLIFAIVLCFCSAFCFCCVRPIALCFDKICCCFDSCFGPKDDPDRPDEDVQRAKCQACLGTLAFIAYFIVWIVSLATIANDCNTDGGIPCVPW